MNFMEDRDTHHQHLTPHSSLVVGCVVIEVPHPEKRETRRNPKPRTGWNKRKTLTSYMNTRERDRELGGNHNIHSISLSAIVTCRY